jgi:hypothetical protein
VARKRAFSKLLAGLFVVLTPVSCALTVSYDGFEKSGASGADAGGAGGKDDGGGLGGCFPVSCGAPGAKCGTVSDKCGDKLDCPPCPAGQTCASGECAQQANCGNGSCEAGESCGTCSQDCKCDDSICSGTTCCEPDCAGKLCGSDSCGGLCGSCPTGMQCDPTGQCISQANCGTGPQTCGDGPGENCESCVDCFCETGVACLGQVCCMADCGGKECGNDGCGHSCGECALGSVCDPKGQCIPQATCGNNLCELGEDCNLCQGDCPCMTGSCSPGGTCCMPDCAGKQCGADGCGSVCGLCPGGTCDPTGHCVSCGDNTCSAGENCGNCPGDCGCPGGQVCQGSTCCAPSCTGKTCGPNGCGSTCPPGCATNFSCNANGVCVQTSGCGNGSCAASENCVSCPQDCTVPGKLCCPDGTSKDCCTSDDCVGDPSLCTIGFCGPDGTCGTQFLCSPGLGDCCDGAGFCNPCGGIGGLGGFGGQTFRSNWTPSNGGAPPR